MMDYTCLLAAILFLLSDVIAIIAVLVYQNQNNFDFNALLQLDPLFIQQEYEYQINHRNIELSYSIINALAWFIFAIPSM